MDENHRILSAKIANMSFVCTIFVVLIHCPRGGVRGTLAWWWTTLVQNGVCQIAVPFFFVTSGYFLAQHMQTAGWWRSEVVKRIRSLCVPFLIWNVLFSVMAFCVAMKSGVLPVSWKSWVHLVGSSIGLIPGFGVSLGALWYVRSLMLLVILSPFLKKCATTTGLVVLFALYALLNPYPSEGRPEWFNHFSMGYLSFCGCAWFTVGIWLRKSGIGEIALAMRNLLILAGGGILMIRGLAVYQGWHWLLGCYLGWGAIPFLMLGIWSTMSETLFPTWLVRQSFPLYVLHGFALMILNRLPGGGRNDVLIGGFSVILLSFFLVFMVRQMGVRVNQILWGGR